MYVFIPESFITRFMKGVLARFLLFLMVYIVLIVVSQKLFRIKCPIHAFLLDFNVLHIDFSVFILPINFYFGCLGLQYWRLSDFNHNHWAPFDPPLFWMFSKIMGGHRLRNGIYIAIWIVTKRVENEIKVSLLDFPKEYNVFIKSQMAKSSFGLGIHDELSVSVEWGERKGYWVRHNLTNPL